MTRAGDRSYRHHLSRDEVKLQSRVAEMHDELDRMFVFTAKLYDKKQENDLLEHVHKARKEIELMLKKLNNKSKTGELR